MQFDNYKHFHIQKKRVHMTELDCFIIPKTSILGHLGLKPEFWVLDHQDFLKNHASPLYFMTL